MSSREDELISFFRKNGGLASYGEIVDAGFSKTLLKTGLDSSRIYKIDRSLYRLSEGMSHSNPDLVAVSLRVPYGVVCLVSALSFHEATKEIPQFVDVAIPRGNYAAKIKYPPVKFYRFDPPTWNLGIEEHKIEGHSIKVYSLARTVADCFKFRNMIGLDVAREALKIAITEKRIKPTEIMQYSKICRVDRITKPILEAML